MARELKSPILNENKAPGSPLCEKAKKKHLAWVLWQCVTAKEEKYETLLIQKTENEIIPKENISQGTQGKSP